MAALLVTITCIQFAPASVRGSPVRPQSERLQRAVDLGGRDSETFRQLVRTLQARQVIVYVVPGSCDFKKREACLLHTVVAAGSYRILRAVVRDDAPAVRLTGVIAHELRHAIEVGESQATTPEDIATLFRRIGRPCEPRYLRSCYETEAAVAAENRVVSDLIISRKRVEPRISKPVPSVEAIEGIQQGLADAKAGRTKPARQVFGRLRRKHGIPR
jgi:hypothetical protein